MAGPGTVVRHTRRDGVVGGSGHHGGMAPSSRLAWAVKRLDLSPTHRVLEIGCGHGVAASAVLDHLTKGQYVGVDRSSAMVEAAQRRNAAAAADGRATFRVGEVPGVDLGPARFDRIVAARVVAMGRPAALRFAVAHLRPGGRLALVVDSPDERRTRAQVGALADAMPDAGFEPPTVDETVVDGALVACVSAAVA